MVYFSQLKGKPIIDADGKEIGLLTDLVFIDGEKYAEISHLICCPLKNKYRKKISWRYVKEIKEEKNKNKEIIDIHLIVPDKETNPSFESETDLLVSNLIDKQIIDVDGLKVVRVNDVLLGKIDGRFAVVAVCVGAKSFAMRLGVGRFTDMLIKGEEHIIPWDSVEPLDPNIQNVHIKLERCKIAHLHPGDIADIIEDLSSKERALVFKSLDERKAAKTIVESEPAVGKSVLEDLKLNRITEMLESVPPNQAADILAMMPKSKTELLLSSMRADVAKKIKEILNYPEESVGSIMRTEFITIPKDYTAQKTINLMRKMKNTISKTFYLYVVDNNKRLLGVLSIRALLIASPKEKVADIMKPSIIKIKTSSPIEEATNALEKYNLVMLPVVDNNNVIQGIVRSDDILTKIIPRSWKKIRFRHLRKKKRNHESKNKS